MESDFRSKRSEPLVIEMNQMNADSVTCVFNLHNYKVVI